MRLIKLTSSAFLLFGFLTAVSHAQVPVVESRPVGTNGSVSISSQSPVIEPESVQAAPQQATGTAHLLQMMDEMRQEIMTLRGQLEEQAYQINQIKQENRDRYLDLDQRITRSVENTSPASLKKPTSPVRTVVKANEPQAPVVDSGTKEETAYQAAFALIKEKRFDDALVAMRNLLKDYPRGQYSDNAQYWLGEIQMAQGKYTEAKSEFLVVVNDYPGSPKVADAAYKLGRVYDLLGEKAEAKKRLESVVSDYPGTTAARLSDTYLRAM